MAELLLSQAFSAGTEIVYMVETAKECAGETVEMYGRVQSTLALLQQAAPVFEDNAFLRRALLDLKTLFESIDDLRQPCFPKAHQQPQQHASLTLQSPEFLQTVRDFTAQLDRIVLFFGARVQSAANHNPTNLVENAVLAIRLVQYTGTDPSLKLAKRRVRGDVIGCELVELGDSLGRGSFGVVMAGKYYGRPVAIKRAWNSAMSAEDREKFRREASTHFALRHDRIVGVIAFHTGGGSRPPSLVMERMDLTLHHFLGMNPAPIEMLRSLSYLMDICEGLKYVHECGIDHGDLKSHNVLLDDWGAKISDCGLGHVCSAIGLKTGNGTFLAEKTGETFWMAPEVFRWKTSSLYSDVFSLHVVVWEMIENRQGGEGRAIGKMLLEDPLEKLPIQGEGGEIDPARQRLHKLVRSCGQLEQNIRPKVGEVLAEVKSIYDCLSGSGNQGSPEGFRRPSDGRRQAQKMMSLESGGSPWEEWRVFAPSEVESEDAPRTRGAPFDGGDLEAAQPQAPPSLPEGGWRQFDVPTVAWFWSGYVAIVIAAILVYSGVEFFPLLVGLFLGNAVFFALAAAALYCFAVKREFPPALVIAKVFAVGVCFCVLGVVASMFYHITGVFGIVVLVLASVAFFVTLLCLMETPFSRTRPQSTR